MFIDKLSTLFSQAYFRLGRMPGYTLLSMLGLVISLSGTVIIARYLHQEWTIDSWIPDVDRTYILCDRYLGGNYMNRIQPAIDENYNNAESYISPTVGQSNVEAFTDVHLRESNYRILLEDEERINVPVISVDSGFANVFPLKVLEGTLLLQTEGQAFVSEDFAQRFFPGESAVGKTLKMGAEETLHSIVGVFRKPAGKSTFHFDVANYAPKGRSINNTINFTVLRLTEGADAEEFNKHQPEIDDHLNPIRRFLIQPYKNKLQRYREELGRNSSDTPSLNQSSSPKYLWMLFAVAVLLFLVGVFNFLNLYAVMRHTREHEMQVRRFFGASRWNLFAMLYAENLLISAPAMLGVWMIIELTTPHMKDWFAIEQMTMPLFDTVLSLSIVFILPLIATAPFLQRRAGSGAVASSGSAAFLFLQYFISLTLITVSLYLMRQLHLMMDSDPGYRTEGLMYYTPRERADWKIKVDDKGQRLYADDRKGGPEILQKLRECPYIEDVISDPQINKPFNVIANGLEMSSIYMNPKVMKMFGLELLEGRMLNDTLDLYNFNCLINETAMKQLGIKDWQTAEIQTASRLWVTNLMEENAKNPPFKVVGILRDFHPGRLSEPQPPMFFCNVARWRFEKSKSLPDDLILSVKPGSEEALIKYLRRMSQEILGTDRLNYKWLSDQKDELYREDRRTARIFFTFSLLAIGVTCLGVLGLMMFDVRRRYREIALRKVHGARFRDIALLLSRRYLIILGLAAAVSIPVSLIGLHKLIIRYYTIHASIAWWIPLVSLALVFLLSALTLSFQIWRATRIEPSEVMKVE